MKAMQFLPATMAVLTFLANQISGAPMDWPPNHYQGSLSESNALASGLYDFEIRLFDAGTNGDSIGIVLCNAEPIENGLFTLALNWPDPIIFNGESRWLELAVRRSGSGNAFTRLEPRQQIGAAPYSLFSFTAETANSVEWGDITSVPPAVGVTYRASQGLAEFRPIFNPPGHLVEFSIAPGGVASSMLAPNAVISDVIANGAVTLSKLETPILPAAQPWVGPFVVGYNGSTVQWTPSLGLIPDGALPLVKLTTSNAAPGQVLTIQEGIAGWKDPVVRTGSVTTASIADGSVTAAKVPQGSLVKSLNGLHDDVLLSVKGGLSLSTIGNRVELEAPLLGDCETYADCFWSLSGNAGTSAGANFLGTTDNQPLELKVNNSRALRLEPAPNVVNVIAGHVNNAVMANYYGGAIGGGADNLITNNFAVIGGGNDNVAGGQNSGVASGNGNYVTGDFSNVGGGLANRNFGFIGTVGGGSANLITNAGYATVAGGYYNLATNHYATVGGGEINVAGGAISTVAGGDQNWALGYSSTIGGGEENRAYGEFSTVGGGYLNGAYAYGAVAVGGGGSTPVGYAGNKAIGPWSAVVGGYANVASNLNSFIGGGALNNAFGNYSVIPGGRDNATTGSDSFAAGRQAKANHDGTFVWADHNAVDFTSTAPDQFLIRAKGGVGVNVNDPTPAGVSIQSPGTALELRQGDLKVTGAGVNTATIAFTHRAGAGSIGGHVTTISNPRTDGRPDAILLVTHNWSKDTAVDPYETHPVGVYYDGAKWNIFHEDSAAMPEGRAFNVMVINP
jgi:hypothetical protein